jgi:glucose-6-phosphate 1-epimerase
MPPTPRPDDQSGRVALRAGHSSVVVDPFGATVLSWTVQQAGSPDSTNLLYMSPMERQVDKPFRGGIPLVFPRFGPSELFPGRQHGFARNALWDLIDCQESECTLALSWTAKEWPGYPNSGRLVVKVHLEEDRLRLSIDVSNVALPFQLLLHTYLAVDPDHAWSIQGLQAKPYEERASGKTGREVQTAADLTISEEMDRIYNVAHYLQSVSLQRSPSMRVQVRSNLPQLVVWNPGREKAVGDLPPDGHRHFVCLENGHVVGLIDPLREADKERLLLWAEYSISQQC